MPNWGIGDECSFDAIVLVLGLLTDRAQPGKYDLASSGNVPGKCSPRVCNNRPEAEFLYAPRDQVLA